VRADVDSLRQPKRAKRDAVSDIARGYDDIDGVASSRRLCHV
jgi:hypothetical protein